MMTIVLPLVYLLFQECDIKIVIVDYQHEIE